MSGTSQASNLGTPIPTEPRSSGSELNTPGAAFDPSSENQRTREPDQSHPQPRASSFDSSALCRRYFSLENNLDRSLSNIIWREFYYHGLDAGEWAKRDFPTILHYYDAEVLKQKGLKEDKDSVRTVERIDVVDRSGMKVAELIPMTRKKLEKELEMEPGMFDQTKCRGLTYSVVDGQCFKIKYRAKDGDGEVLFTDDQELW